MVVVSTLNQTFPRNLDAARMRKGQISGSGTETKNISLNNDLKVSLIFYERESSFWLTVTNVAADLKISFAKTQMRRKANGSGSNNL
jgi:hypothetical protein